MADNRKARFNYQILDSFEVGIVLTGGEVKSVRDNQVTIEEAYAKITEGELWLLNAHIAPYKFSANESYNPTRPRKLLAKKDEITKLNTKLSAQGLTLVPLKMYIARNHIKLELGIAKGKKLYDKRESIKNREVERMQRRKTS